MKLRVVITLEADITDAGQARIFQRDPNQYLAFVTVQALNRSRAWYNQCTGRIAASAEAEGFAQSSTEVVS